MKSSNLVKIAVAFLIGVAVTLGSALLYFRTTDNFPPESPSSTASIAPEPSPAPEPQESPTVVNPPVRTQPVQPLPLPPARAEVQTRPARPAPPREPKKKAVTVLAQSHPLPATLPPPEPVTPPSPVVNDSPTAASVPSDIHPAQPNVPSSYPDPAFEPHVITLQPGTNLAIRLGETLSSDHNYAGDTFRGTLESPVIVDGFIIADKGSKVLGKIIQAQSAGRVQGLSGLTLALVEINTTDGQHVRVQTDSYQRRGPSSTGTDAATIAGGAAIGALIGAIAGGGKGAAIGAGAGGAAGTGVILATRGKPMTLPVEMHLSFRLNAPVTITEQINH